MIWLLLACTPSTPDVRPPEVEEAWPEEELVLPALEALPPPVPCSPGEVALSNGVPYPTLTAALDATVSGTVTACPGVHEVVAYYYPHPGPLRLTGGAGNRDAVVVDSLGLGYAFDFRFVDNGLLMEDLTVRNMAQDILSGVSAPTFGNFIARRMSFVGSVNTTSLNTQSPHALLEDLEFLNNSNVSSDTLSIRSRHANDITRVVNVYIGNDNSPIVVEITTSDFVGRHVIDIEGLTIENSQGEEMLSVILDEDATWLRIRDSAFINNRVTNEVLHVFNRGEPTARVLLEGVSFIDNRFEGYNGTVIGLTDFYRPRGQQQVPAVYDHVALMREITMHGNQGDFPGAPKGVIEADRWRVRLIDADMGVGPDENHPRDLRSCPLNLGRQVTGWIDQEALDFCP